MNQIVLSHEFGSVKDLYDRRRQVGEFRKRVERRTGQRVSSPKASAFFRSLLDGVDEAATALRDDREEVGESGHDAESAADTESAEDTEPSEEIEAYVESAVAEVRRASDELADDESTMLDTLLAMLAYDDSVQFYETRRVRNELDGELSDAARAKLFEIEELFTEIDAARQYLKTVVVERQLARLSRLLVYTGIPAVAALGIFTYRDVAGLALSHETLVVVAGTLVAVSLVPLAILSAYILRVATSARKTAAFGPFVSESKLSSNDGRE